MVVPKRAALLLDRLMVALHHALEKEHSGSARLSEFYNNKNGNNDNMKNIATGTNDRNKDDNDDNVEDTKGACISKFSFYFNSKLLSFYTYLFP